MNYNEDHKDWIGIIVATRQASGMGFGVGI